MGPITLPHISDSPMQHPDCCASLSTTLINNIIAFLPTKNATIASIGCGSGLLEALLMQQLNTLKVTGIEVMTCPVKYLHYSTRVQGTWDRSAAAFRTDAWLFVYPRNPKLIEAYLKALDEDARLETIIWIGPACDWVDFEIIFRQRAWGFMAEVVDAGIAEYETMVVIRRKPMSAHAVSVAKASKDEPTTKDEPVIKVEPAMDIHDI